MKKESFEKAQVLYERIADTRKILTAIQIATAAYNNIYYFSSGPALQIEIPSELTKDFLSELKSYYEGIITECEKQIEKI